jgi:hypothetical protein
MNEAQSYLDRAEIINAKVEAERQRMIGALNQALIVIIMFTVAGLSALSQAEHQLKHRQLETQEQIPWKR